MRAWVLAVLLAGCSATPGIHGSEDPEPWSLTRTLDDQGVMYSAADIIWQEGHDTAQLNFAIDINGTQRGGPQPDIQVAGLFIEHAIGPIGTAARQELIALPIGGTLYSMNLGNARVTAAGYSVVETGNYGGSMGVSHAGGRVLPNWDVPMRLVFAVAWTTPEDALAPADISFTATLADGAALHPSAWVEHGRAGLVSSFSPEPMAKQACAHHLWASVCAVEGHTAFATEEATWLFAAAHAGSGAATMTLSHDGTTVLQHEQRFPDEESLNWKHRGRPGQWQMDAILAGGGTVLDQPYYMLFWADMPGVP